MDGIWGGDMDILEIIKNGWEGIVALGAKDLSEVLKNYATFGVFIIGGFWAYLTFIRKREKYPCANLNHKIIHRKLDDNKIFLRVTVEIHNNGITIMYLDRKLVRVQQMIPWPKEALELIAKKERIEEQNAEVQWPLLGEIDLKGEKQGYEIEPGESEEFHFDFIIDSEIKSVLIYSYLRNRKKRGREIGWNKTSVYDINNMRS